ncbi:MULTISPECIES: PspC domain-containing protein [unclassified Corynebacterium]|uniref:PspC domain-containing protein n=1 Tax=unclassified Corynebacterium TaxID=2624378 RepID=UPI00309D6600
MDNPQQNGLFNSEQISQGIDKAVGRPVRRSHSNRMVAGVCGGFADATGFDVTAMRVIMAVLGIAATPVALVLYLAAWLFVPSQ